jgi:hypothetical protein
MSPQGAEGEPENGYYYYFFFTTKQSLILA